MVERDGETMEEREIVSSSLSEDRIQREGGILRFLSPLGEETRRLRNFRF